MRATPTRFVMSSLLILAVLTSFHCKKEAAAPAKISAIVLFKVGSAMAAGKELAAGDIIRKGTEIVLGPQSILDMQVREADSTVTMRVQANSHFVLDARTGKDGQVISPLLQSGGVLTRVEKMSGKESLEIRTPSAIAAVRGTKFEAQVAADGSSSLQVHEGKVATRPRAAAVENLPPALIEETPQLGALVSTLEKSETVLESGQGTTVSRSAGEKLVRDAGVEGILSQPQIQNLKPDAKPEDIQKAQAALQTHFASAENQAKARDAAAKPPAAPVPVKIEDTELKRKLQEYDEFVARKDAAAAAEPEAQKAVSTPNPQMRTVEMRRIENIMGKSSETLILTNGTRVQGVVIQQGMDYMVLTPEGRVFYSSAQVQGLEF